MAKKKQEKEQTITGLLRMHPRGFGFVIPDDPTQMDQDVFIPKQCTDNAVDGDQVKIAINPNSDWEKGPDGKIIEVLQRGRHQIAGIISQTKETIMAHVPLLGESRPVVIKKGKNLKEGDRVLLEVTEWGNQKNPTRCKLLKVLGHIEDPKCDIPAATQEYSLQTTFPLEVVEQAKSYGNAVKKNEGKGRLDLTLTPCITIDPETAKDFDDALSIEQDAKGNFFLGVHIADVSHYIPPDSPLDIEAKKRSNSTYFPGSVVPMLPEELSNNLCSLRQGVNRLTVSVLMQFDKEGTLTKKEVKRSIIKSQKRFTYQEAKRVLDGKKESPHAKALSQMVTLCQLLKKKRTERGSIDFALPELVIKIDKEGRPTGVKIEEYDITHQLVEEFMLKANEVVAKLLSDRGKELIFRVHEEPESSNLEDFFATARTLGFKVPKEPTQEDIQALFEAAKKTPFSHQLSVGFIRNLKLAYYSPQNVGHYGLSLDHYCHFTSPIRRYSDLIVHRVLFDEEADNVDLKKIAQDCSDQERLSFRAESSVKQLKKYRLLRKWFEEDPSREYSANITKIKPFGLFFEVKELFLEGYLHISELENDYFVYEPKVPMLVGRSSGLSHKIGNDILVKPIRIDLVHQDASWILSLPKKKQRKKKR